MPTKSAPKKKKSKDTPAKQYERFLETAREVGASSDAKDFDKAFKRVALPAAKAR
jgi:hypothetical protein